MNNTDFKRLLATPRPSGPTSSVSNGTKKSSTPGSSFAPRARTLIPMTPRAVAGSSYANDFARQLAERNADGATKKKTRAAPAPRGTKYSDGYIDRAAARAAANEEDDRAARIKALEEQMKLGQIEQGVFEQLRDQITGGDVTATHLVKGLDRKLLERVRHGEDVLSGAPPATLAQSEEKEADVDDALGELEQKEVTVITHETVAKKGEMAPPPAVAGAKRSRNDILAELKASRLAAQEAAAAESKLNSRFRKISDKKTGEPRIERDERGREVMITVDEHGRVKRKVRKVAAPPAAARKSDLLVPDMAVKPLGMEVPIVPKKSTPPPQAEDDDDDIFADAGVAYNPLGDIPNDDSASSSDEESKSADEQRNQPIPPFISDNASVEDKPQHTDQSVEQAVISSAPNTTIPNMSDEPQPSVDLTQKRNYFGTTTTSDTNPASATHVPDIMNVIKRAAALGDKSTSDSTSTSATTAAGPSTAAQRLLARDRDMDDLDMGFGSSRFGDEEDEEGGDSKVKLSEWKGSAGGEDDDEGEGGKQKGGGGVRKRGKKKPRKGDKNSVSDVLRVMQGRGKD